MINQQKSLATGPATVERVDRCRLSLSKARWAFADRNGQAIDALWVSETERNPHFFNGPVHLVCNLHIADGALTADLLRTDFKSCLYWRRQGFPAAGVIDGFGSGLITTADGAIILGRQRSGNINAGLAYLPAGFIDDSDVGSDGDIDIVASVLREVGEETGLTGVDLDRSPGFYVVRSQSQLSIAVPLISSFNADDVVRRIETHITASPHSELDAVVAVKSLDDLAPLDMPHYTRPLVEWCLTHR